MSKQSNTAIFLVVATIVNILLMFAIFIIFFLIAGFLFDLNGDLGLIMLGLSFVIAIGGSVFIYSKLVNWAVIKFNLEDKLVPLFGKRRGHKK